MASQKYLYSEVLNRSESPKVVRQEDVKEESHRRAESNQSRDGCCLPLVSVDLRIKKEMNTEDYSQESFTGYSSADTSRQTLLDEYQKICLKENSWDNSKKAEHEIKEERKDIKSPIDDTKASEEARIFEKDFQVPKGGTRSSREKETDLEKEKVDVLSKEDEIHDTLKISKGNHWDEGYPSKQGHLPSKRKLHEIYAEELSLRNVDQRTEAQRNHPITHAFRSEAKLWHPSQERKTPKNVDRVYSHNIDTHLYASPATRLGFLGIPSDYAVADGIGSKFEARTKERIHMNTTHFSPIDPRKIVLSNDPRPRYNPSAIPDEELYRPLYRDEIMHKAWYPQYGPVFTNPASPERYSKKDFKKRKEEMRSYPSPERLEHHLRLQTAPRWPHFDHSAGRDGAYETQRIAFLRAERQGKDEPFSLEKKTVDPNPEGRASMEEYSNYVHVPNMLMPTPNSEYFVNGEDLHGLQRMRRNFGHPFPLAENSNIAFIENESVCYPCCKESLHNHYEDMAAKTRWFDMRQERQRVNPFHASKPAIVLRENPPQTLILNEAGARIFRVEDTGNNEQNCPEEREIPNGLTHGSDVHHETLKKQSSFEEFLTAERQRLVERNRIKQVLNSKEVVLPYSSQNCQAKKSLETKANTEKLLAGQEIVYESRKHPTGKEASDSKMCKITGEARMAMVKKEEVQKVGKVLTGVGQTKEALQDPNNSETQRKISLEQDKQNQDDSRQKKIISCTVCNKSFNRTSNLYTHMRTHSANKPHACEFCGKRFHQKADLRIHRYIHTGEKPHKCTKCGRGFKQLTHLKYHMRTHSDVRMYKCPYCEKGFNQKSNLQAHIFGHTGQRPHKCETCGKGFTLASTLNTHKRTHLPNKPFKCEFCDRAFYQKNALKMHYVSTHPYSSGACLA